MRSTRTLLAASALALLAACAESSSPVQPADRAFRDGTGFGGSGNFVGTDTLASGTMTTSSTDTTTTSRGVGFGGSGN